MARPPADPSPVASTGGVANAQGQAIFTGDWNSLITDYISSTDATTQTIASLLGLGAAPGSNTRFLVDDTAIGDGYTTGLTLLQMNMAKKSGGTGSIIGITIGGGPDLNGTAPGAIRGLSFRPQVLNTGAAVTLPLLQGTVEGFRFLSLGATNIITEYDGIVSQATSTGAWPTITTARAFYVPAQGNANVTTFYGLDIGALTAGTKIGIREQSGGPNLISGKTRIGDQTTPTNPLEVAGNQTITGILSNYNGVATTGFGVPAIVGLDNRTGVTAADGSPITLYAVPAGATQLYRITADIFATAFTSGTATYTITWTENAVARTLVVTATALNTLGTGTDMVNPDASTNITAQLTGVFTATVKIAGLVERLA